MKLRIENKESVNTHFIRREERHDVERSINSSVADVDTLGDGADFSRIELCYCGCFLGVLGVVYALCLILSLYWFLTHSCLELSLTRKMSSGPTVFLKISFESNIYSQNI